jgi:hypothetical protein
MSTEFNDSLDRTTDIFQNILDNPDFLSTASNVHYSPIHNDITLVMSSGIQIHIPLSHIDEFNDVPKAVIKQDISLGIGGEAIYVHSHDIHISIKSLLKYLFGLR